MISFAAIARTMSWRSLSGIRRSLRSLLFPVVVASNALHGDLSDAKVVATSFGIVLAYYFSLLATVISVDRLLIFLASLVAVITATALLALLQYHGIVKLDADEYGISVLERYETAPDISDDPERFVQLAPPGIFSDPNDLAAILVVGLILASHGAMCGRGVLRRLLWLSPLPILVYAFALTQSRGGFLSLLAAASTYLF